MDREGGERLSMASDPACPANSPRSWPVACRGLYLSKKRAGCRGGTYAWYPKCSATSYLGVGIRLYRANRQARRQGGRRDARLAAPMNRDGRHHDATRWCWWPLGLSVPCILCCGHEWPAGKTGVDALTNGRRSGRMGASGLPWGHGVCGDGSLFFSLSIVCANSVDSSWRAAVPGRRPRRPISIAEAVVLGSVHAPRPLLLVRVAHTHTGPPARGPICAHSTPRLVTARRLHDYRFALQKKQWLFPPPHSLQQESPPHTEGTAESKGRGRKRKASKPDHSVVGDRGPGAIACPAVFPTRQVSNQPGWV